MITLEFEGVYRDAVVSVNGTVAAHRPYGYSNFFVPIDHLLRRDGENEVRVEVRAGDDSRWYSGAGIYRNVWLLSAGPVFLVPDGLQVRTPEIDANGAIVTVAAEVRNRSLASSQAALAVELVDADGAVVARSETPVTTFPGDTITARTRLHVVGARRWGPDDPYLYTCRATLVDGDDVVDEESTTFGIRSLAVDPERGLRINGEPVLLRGACVHHDNGVLGAATIDRADERRVERLHVAGYNAIRSAHNPMSKAMLRACDRLGMLVMDETFDMWLQTKSEDDYALRFADWWEADVEAMVRKDINHPSVILYSIGNEVPDGSTAVGVQVGRALAEKVRDLDDTRFVTQAVTGMLVGGRGALRRDPRRGGEHRDRRGDRRQHRGDEPGRHHGGSDALARRHGQDPGGVLAPRRRRVQLHGDPLRAGSRALPAPGDRRDRVPSAVPRQGLVRGAAEPERHRRLHLDRLGLPRRGGHRARGTRRAAVRPRHGRLPRRLSVARGVVRGLRHHRSAPSAVVLPRDRVGLPDRSIPRGPPA